MKMKYKQILDKFKIIEISNAKKFPSMHNGLLSLEFAKAIATNSGDTSLER